MPSGACKNCLQLTRDRLIEIPVLYKEAHLCMLPGSGGRGSSSGEMSIGINVAALDYVSGIEILSVLHRREEQVLYERTPTPTASDSYKGPVEARVIEACAFHRRHLHWWAKHEQIQSFISDVERLHFKGMAATRQIMPRTSTVRCPADFDDGLCGAILNLGELQDLHTKLPCKRCHTEWTTARLVLVALKTPGRDVWLDSEGIATYLDIPTRKVRDIALRFSVRRWGPLYNLGEIMAKRIPDDDREGKTNN